MPSEDAQVKNLHDLYEMMGLPVDQVDPASGFTIHYLQDIFKALPFTINMKGSYFTMQQAARHVKDNSRIIYIASSTTSWPILPNSLPAISPPL